MDLLPPHSARLSFIPMFENLSQLKPLNAVSSDEANLSWSGASMWNAISPECESHYQQGNTAARHSEGQAQKYLELASSINNDLRGFILSGRLFFLSQWQQ